MTSTNDVSRDANAKQAAGTGDQWLARWKADRTDRYEPKFAELINSSSFPIARPAQIGAGSRSCRQIHARAQDHQPRPRFQRRHHARTRLGQHAGGILRYEGPHQDLLAVITILKAPGRDGMGYDFDAGYRLQEGYAKTGKELGILVSKKISK